MTRHMIFILLLVASIYSQKGMVVVGGTNLADITMTHSNVDDAIDRGTAFGIQFGLEKLVGPVAIGVAYVERGINIKDFLLDGTEFTAKMNYFTVSAKYQVKILEDIEVCVGGGFGKYLNGQTTSEYNGEVSTGTIDDSGFRIDYGAILGLNYWVTKTIGLRADYYHGLSDIDENQDLLFSGRHKGLQLDLLFRF